MRGAHFGVPIARMIDCIPPFREIPRIGGSEGGMKAGGLKDPHYRINHVGSYALYLRWTPTL